MKSFNKKNKMKHTTKTKVKKKLFSKGNVMFSRISKRISFYIVHQDMYVTNCYLKHKLQR